MSAPVSASGPTFFEVTTFLFRSFLSTRCLPGSAPAAHPKPDRCARAELPSARPAVADVRGQRRMQHLDGLQPERSDAVEDPLAGPEQDRGDVERELVDDPGDERLPNGGGAA